MPDPLSPLLVLLPHLLDSPHRIPDTMLPNILFLALLWATQTLLVSGRSSFFRTRSLPGPSEYDTWKAMRRAFAGSGLQQRDTTEKSTSLDKSWEDATLFAFTGCAHSSPVSLSHAPDSNHDTIHTVSKMWTPRKETVQFQRASKLLARHATSKELPQQSSFMTATSILATHSKISPTRSRAKSVAWRPK